MGVINAGGLFQVPQGHSAGQPLYFQSGNQPEQVCHIGIVRPRWLAGPRSGSRWHSAILVNPGISLERFQPCCILSADYCCGRRSKNHERSVTRKRLVPIETRNLFKHRLSRIDPVYHHSAGDWTGRTAKKPIPSTARASSREESLSIYHRGTQRCFPQGK